MSKSIYDEALDNTQTLLALVNLKELNSKKKLDMLNQIEQALEQAQKQEKLLELYKELITVKDDLFSCCEIVDDGFYDIRKIETHLEKQIKELE